jgi:hypothetical protein
MPFPIKKRIYFNIVENIGVDVSGKIAFLKRYMKIRRHSVEIHKTDTCTRFWNFCPEEGQSTVFGAVMLPQCGRANAS